MLGFFPLHRVLFAAAILFTSASASVAAQGSWASHAAAEHLLLNQANQDRIERNLPELKADPLLAEAALFHAHQMAEHADISHAFPGEPDLSLRGAAAGVRFSLITENVAEAGDLAIIHELWMHSPGHRANLLDPDVNVVGIAVVTRKDAVYAVEDFASTVDQLSLDDQETKVADLLLTIGLQVISPAAASVENARQTCSMAAGYAGVRQPWFIMRYTSSRLDALPQQLRTRLASGKYHRAVVGACTSSEAGAFTSYNIAILLYP